jgi:hypothetical protein
MDLAPDERFHIGAFVGLGMTKLLIDVDAKLQAVALMQRIERERPSGVAMMRYSIEAGGGQGGAGLLPSGLVDSVTIEDDVKIGGVLQRKVWKFARAELDVAWQVLRNLPRREDRELLTEVYFVPGRLAAKAGRLGFASKQALNYQRNTAVQRFAHHCAEAMGRTHLHSGQAVVGVFASDVAANDGGSAGPLQGGQKKESCVTA